MIFLLDNGHGYETPGKRSPVWPDGRQLLEWQFAREMVRAIDALGTARGLLCVPIVPEDTDAPLDERCRRANRWQRELGGCVLISIHSNAGGGTGFEVYTSKGKTGADAYAEVLCKELKGTFPDIKFRADCADGDLDKEADFYILKHTTCPAMLAELLFMDNYEDCKKLLDPRFRTQMAVAIVGAMQKMNER